MEHIFFDFILTVFIDGIEHPIDIFGDHSLIFDNPRTDKEIKSIASLIRDMCPNDIPPNLNNVLYKGRPFTISDFLTSFYEHKKTSQYICDRKDKVSFANVYEEIASFWVIIRGKIDTAIPIHPVSFPRSTNKMGYSLESEEAQKTKSYSFSYNMLMLLTFLAFKQDGSIYLLKSYINSSPLENIFETYSTEISTMAFLFAFSNMGLSFKFTSMKTDFSEFISSICEAAKNFKTKMSSKNLMEKLTYISEIIATYNSEIDYKMKILLLTSVVEMVLTHNPDSNRFNVEDSITKQFTKNCLVLLYLENPTLDVVSEQKLLNCIYSLRSSIAHGNFDNISKIQKELSLYMKSNPIEGLYQEADLGFDVENDLSFFYTYITYKLETLCQLCINYLIKREDLITILKK